MDACFSWGFLLAAMRVGRASRLPVAASCGDGFGAAGCRTGAGQRPALSWRWLRISGAPDRKWVARGLSGVAMTEYEFHCRAGY